MKTEVAAAVKAEVQDVKGQIQQVHTKVEQLFVRVKKLEETKTSKPNPGQRRVQFKNLISTNAEERL